MESKRVLSEARIPEQIERGIDQLEKTVTTDGDIGIVAVSVSKLLDPGDRILIGDNPQDALERHLDALLRPNERFFGSMAKPWAASILFFLSCAFGVPGLGFTRGKCGTIFPLNLSEQPFLQRLAGLLKV
jgi:hypothetical protein